MDDSHRDRGEPRTLQQQIAHWIVLPIHNCMGGVTRLLAPVNTVVYGGLSQGEA
jgi:hypothetical protein